jgi:hypothetical protein
MQDGPLLGAAAPLDDQRAITDLHGHPRAKQARSRAGDVKAAV